MAVNVSGGPLAFIADLDVNPFERESQKLRKIIQDHGQQFTQSAERQTKQLESLASKATAAVGAFLSINAAQGFISEMVKVRGEFQQLETALTTFLGSKEKSDKLMSEAVKLAAITPFTLKDVGQGSKQLLAYGFAAESITENLTKLGNIASGVGVPLNDLVYLYGTLRTQGTAMTKDIREFAGRGVPIIAELAKQFGVAESSIFKMAEQGKISFADIEKAFSTMTSAGGMFFNLMEEQSKTLTGRLSNLEDAWSRMLNDLGKSNEGALNTTITGAITLVDNYQKVVDILKVLLITYGAYRASLVLTAATQRIQQEMALQSALANTKLTGVMQLQAAASITLQRAWASLTTTIAAAAPLAVIAAVGVAIYSLTQTVDAAAESQENLNEIQQEGAKEALAETEKVRQLTEVLKDKTATQNEQATAIKKIREVTGEYLKGFTDEQIKAGQAKEALDKYITSVENLGAAKAAAKAISLLEDDLVNLQVKGADAVDTFERLGENLKGFFGFGDYTQISYFDQLIGGKASDAVVENKKKGIKQQLADIRNLYKDELKKLYTDPETTGTPPPPIVEQDLKLQKKINSVLDDRKGLLEAITDLQRESLQSGLLKEQSEIDKTREKYEKLFNEITAYNNATDAFNRKNGTKVARIGLTDINALKQAENNQVANLMFKEDAEKYKAHLETQQDIFSQYEEAKKQIGIESADSLYQEQTGRFKSYIEYLEAEINKVKPKITAGTATKADLENLESLNSKYTEATKKRHKDELSSYTDSLAKAINETKTYNVRKAEITDKFAKQALLLSSKYTGEELKERMEVNADLRQQELDALEKDMGVYAQLYKNLNEDISNATRAEVQKRIKEFRKILTDGFFQGNDGKQQKLSLVDEANLKAGIAGMQNLLQETDPFLQSLDKASSYLGAINSGFGSVADSLKGLNSDLSFTLSQMASLGSAVLQSAQAASQLMTPGQEAAGVASAFGSISGYIKLLAQAKASQKQVQADILAFNQAIAAGELDINATYRERARIVSDLHSETLKGLKAETEELKRQKEQVDRDYKSVFDKIRKEQYVMSESEKKNNIFSGVLKYTPVGAVANLFGIGKGSEVDKALGSLASKSFDELERLFAEGRLTDQAKELFQQLQKLKSEGADIDSMLEDNKRKAQEMFTGTTADSITDSIADGFANGFRSVEEFAGKAEDVIRGAMLNALKYQVLQEPIEALFKQFAADAESGGGLDLNEIEKFTTDINATIQKAAQFAEQMQQATGINLSGLNATSGRANSLSGAIKGISEQQADLLAGQFGGLRLTAIEQLKVSSSSLSHLEAIAHNTGFLIKIDKTLGNMELNGVKIKP